MPFGNELWSDEWERRKIRNRLHLTFTGCLGPCIAGNNALLQLHGRSIWFKDLNSPGLVPAVFDFAQKMLDEGKVLPPPPRSPRPCVRAVRAAFGRGLVRTCADRS